MRSLTTLLLLAGLLGTASAHAGKIDLGELLRQVDEIAVSDSKDRPELVIAQRGGLSLSEAIELVKRQTKGRIVDARTKVKGGCETHYIKVLTEDGKVRTRTVQGRCRQS